MKIRIEVKCLSGSVRVYDSKAAKTKAVTVLKLGESIEVLLVDSEGLPQQATRREIEAHVEKNPITSWNACGVGIDAENAGKFTITPLDAPLVLREMRKVGSPGEATADYAVKVDQPMTRTTVGGFLLTVAPVGLALRVQPL